MASIDPPGKAKPNTDGAAATGRLPEPPTSQALWPTFMRRTIATEPLPRPKNRPTRLVRAAS